MKKFFIALLALFVFTVTLPLTADAQSCRRKVRKSSASRTVRRSTPRYAVNGYTAQRRPSFYRAIATSSTSASRPVQEPS